VNIGKARGEGVGGELMNPDSFNLGGFVAFYKNGQFVFLFSPSDHRKIESFAFAQIRFSDS
jgi:hypothetical protein